MNGSGLNLYKRFINSISGFNGYKLLLSETPGKAVVFVLLLSLILGTISIIGPVRDYNSGISLVATDFDKIVPEFELKNGELQVEGNMPIILKDDNLTIIIDTSGKTDQSLLDNYNNALLITKTEMIQKDYANRSFTDFSNFKNLTFNKSDVKAMIPLLRWAIVFIIIFGIFFFIAGKFISALVISLFGLIINSALHAGLKFREIYRVTLYSMTLPIILCTILDLFSTTQFISLLIFYTISCIYTWGAIRSMSKPVLPE